MFHLNLVYENLEPNFWEGSLTTKKNNNATKNNLHANPEDPWWSMHGIFTYGSHKKNQPNVGKYTTHRSYGKWSQTSQRKKKMKPIRKPLLKCSRSRTVHQPHDPSKPDCCSGWSASTKEVLKKQRWRCFVFISDTSSKMVIWLAVSTHLKNISQIGPFPQVGVKIKNIWNHHPVIQIPDLRNFHNLRIQFEYNYLRCSNSSWYRRLYPNRPCSLRSGKPTNLSLAGHHAQLKR